MSEHFIHDGNHHHHDAGALSDTNHFGEHQPHDINLFSKTPFGLYSNEAIMHHPDPLSGAHKFDMPPLKLHFVKPHLVNGYTREDGTVVKPYIRDGEGGGYLRSNPDGDLMNNLNTILGQ